MKEQLASYWRLVSGGVTASSLLLYPIRRRLPQGRNRLDLRSGESLRSTPEEQLLTLVEEVWVAEKYRPPDWSPTPSMTVVDVGANVGVFTTWAAHRLRARRVVAVEPAGDSVEQLRDNLRRNGVEAEIVQAALGGESGQRLLYRRGAPSLDTLYHHDRYNSTFSEVEIVSVLTLDEIFSRFALDRCDLLKLDCEGAEYEILGATTPATLKKIRHVVGEYHVGLNDHESLELADILERAEFDVRLFPLLDVEGGYLHAARRR